MKRLSKLFKDMIIRLYKNGTYDVAYALIVASNQLDKNRLTEADFEELVAFFEEELAKEEFENIEEDTTEEVTEETEQPSSIE